MSQFAFRCAAEVVGEISIASGSPRLKDFDNFTLMFRFARSHAANPGFATEEPMKVQLFLEHHGLTQNPFSQEDAQTDPLFQKLGADGTFHPAWEKIYGDPATPSTAVVFGEKGSGKTALRLQIDLQI